MQGIYIIKNKLTQQIYVGQSINFPKRKRRHLRNLNNGTYKEFNKLYPAMKKMGLENFEFIFIEECSIEMLAERELYWIDYYNSIANGYNLSHGKSGGIGYWKGKSRNPETNKKISLKLKGTKLSNETKLKIGKNNEKSMLGNSNGNKKILCVELNIKFNSIKEAAEYIKVHPSNVSKCLKGVQKTAGNCTWKYLK